MNEDNYLDIPETYNILGATQMLTTDVVLGDIEVNRFVFYRYDPAPIEM
jgi:hypothetical protein